MAFRNWFKRGWFRILAVGWLVVLAVAGPVPAAQAAPVLAPQGCPLVVSNTNDTGPGSLRSAVACVQSGETVTFSAGLAGATISLTSGEIAINQSITINGTAAAGVIVDAGNLSRIFNITTSGPVTLTALALQHGSAVSGGAVYAGGGGRLQLSQVAVLSSTATAGNGGGAYVSGVVALTDGRFQGNGCSALDCHGGGLIAVSTLALTGTEFISNTSKGGGNGAFAGGAVTLTNGRFQGNTCAPTNCSGGGLMTTSTLALTGTEFISNTSRTNGGGVWAGGAVTVTNGRFQGNACTTPDCWGGGLYAYSTLALTGTEFISNTSTYGGGGAYGSGAVTLTNGRFQGNACTAGCFGGGLYTFSTLALTGTEFVSNTSTTAGGGAYVSGAATLTYGRFQGNACTCVGGGLYASTLTLTGTHFISNTSSGDGGGAYVGAATLANSRFQGNSCTAAGCQGGGLRADTLALTDTKFVSNTSHGSGGGAYLSGAVTLTSGRFEGNACTESGCGGGGLFTLGTLALTGTHFISNTSSGFGGGAYAHQTVTLTNGRFEGNACTLTPCAGGGLLNDSTLVLTGTQFISNTSTVAGGGAFAVGTVTLVNGHFEGNVCTLANCSGGGLYFEVANITNSSFNGNQAGGQGGALAFGGSAADLTLVNSTLSGNTAQSAGGALYAGGGQVRLLNVTLAGNQAPSGGGLFAVITATVGVTNTLFDNNGPANCTGPIDIGTHNLEWPGSTCALAGPSAGFGTADPLLGPLALNAPGLTWTHALLADSPARDAGDAATCAGPSVNNRDQRGVVRPINGDSVAGAACDLGAFEAPALPFYVVYLPQLLR